MASTRPRRHRRRDDARGTRGPRGACSVGRTRPRRIAGLCKSLPVKSGARVKDPATGPTPPCRRRHTRQRRTDVELLSYKYVPKHPRAIEQKTTKRTPHTTSLGSPVLEVRDRHGANERRERREPAEALEARRLRVLARLGGLAVRDGATLHAKALCRSEHSSGDALAARHARATAASALSPRYRSTTTSPSRPRKVTRNEGGTRTE